MFQLNFFNSKKPETESKPSSKSNPLIAQPLFQREYCRAGQHIVLVERIAHRRTMRLSVDINGTLRVLASKKIRQTEIVDFVVKNTNWIEGRLGKVSALQNKYPPRAFRTGEKFLFRGRDYQLQVEPGCIKRPTIREAHDRLVAQIPFQQWCVSNEFAPYPSLQDAMRRFYQEAGQRILLEKTKSWSSITGLVPSKVIFRAQRTLWGSCNSRKVVSLNWKLIAAPDPVVDYVIVHELCHLKHPNHSQKFWSLVGEFVFDHKTSRTWLKDKQFCFDFLEKESHLFMSKLF